jgi:GH24 family phage-related lysozyme (muramidase)
MNLSQTGLDLIKASEGFKPAVYNDVAGFPTIGYGHKLLPGESFPNGVTEAQATNILSSDANQAVQAVNRLVTVSLTQGQFDALVDFTYNLGAGALTYSTLLKLLNEGQYDAAGQQLLLWDHAAGVVSAGLLTRREAELALWNSAQGTVQ